MPTTDSQGEAIAVAVDSGAHDAAVPLNVGTPFHAEHAEAPGAGKRCSAARGAAIRKYGQRVIVGRSENGAAVSMLTQAADVTKH